MSIQIKPINFSMRRWSYRAVKRFAAGKNNCRTNNQQGKEIENEKNKDDGVCFYAIAIDCFAAT